MKSKPLNPPPAICGSNITAWGRSLFCPLKEEGEEITAVYSTSQNGQPAFTAVPWRWNEPPVTENKQEAERGERSEREKPVPFILPQ